MSPSPENGRDRVEKLKIGIPGDEQEIRVELPDEEPRPWDLDTKLRVANQRTPKVDARAKVTGKAKYTYDQKLPGMLYGAMIRCPHAAAEVKSLDLSAARKIPGVKAAMELPNAPKRIRYAGQAIGALAAEDLDALAAGLEAVKADYEVLPHVVSVEAASEADAPAVWSSRRPNISRGRGRRRNQERVAKGIEDAKIKVALKATTQVQVHSCLEPHGTLAHWPESDRLEVWSSTQATFGVRDGLARALQMDSSQVRVHCEFMGAGFGSKFSAGDFSLAAALLSRETGKPVRIMLDRRNEQIDGGNRPDSRQDMAAALDDEKRLAFYRVEKDGTPGVGRSAAARNPMIYSVGRTDSVQLNVATNTAGSKAFRAPGYPQGSFGLELMMNAAAEAAGMDPLAFRQAHDDHPIRAREYVLGAEKIGWSERKATGSETGRFRRGFGIAASTWPNFGGPEAEADCIIHKDGSVESRSGAQDIGVGTRTLLAIVTAEELGLQVDDIRTAIGDTNDPFGPASGGSRTASSLAPAVRTAAYQAGIALRELVAREMGLDGEDPKERLSFKEGRIVLDGGAKGMSFADACSLIQEGNIKRTGKRIRNFSAYQREVGGCQFAKVVVDCELGLVEIEHIVALQDCGIILNRMTTEGQVLGGVIQGISYALLEERIMDPISGVMLNADMEAYKIAGPVDIPRIDVELVESAIGANNVSVAGVGEPTSVPTAAAIAGAVHNAIGVPLHSIPMTPARILKALEGA